MLKATRQTVSIPDDARCQEASPLSVSAYIPCRMPAEFLVDNGDANPYFMCGECAAHNVDNRGAVILLRKDK